MTVWELRGMKRTMDAGSTGKARRAFSSEEIEDAMTKRESEGALTRVLVPWEGRTPRTPVWKVRAWPWRSGTIRWAKCSTDTSDASDSTGFGCPRRSSLKPVVGQPAAQYVGGGLRLPVAGRATLFVAP